MAPQALYDLGLDKNAANFAPLTPLTFLAWSARVFPNRPAVIHGARRFNWQETYNRCRCLASALRGRGIGAGATVAAMLCNTPEMYECHFGVPMAGAVLNTLNTRLDADAIAFTLKHGEAKALITDREFSEIIKSALGKLDSPPLVIDVDDPEDVSSGTRIGETDYEAPHDGDARPDKGEHQGRAGHPGTQQGRHHRERLNARD